MRSRWSLLHRRFLANFAKLVRISLLAATSINIHPDAFRLGSSDNLGDPVEIAFMEDKLLYKKWDYQIHLVHFPF